MYARSPHLHTFTPSLLNILTPSHPTTFSFLVHIVENDLVELLAMIFKE